MACPLPPPGASLEMTRAPATRASSAVRSLDPSSTTRTSSTRGVPPVVAVRAETIECTIGPTVAASLRAGMHTEMRRPPFDSASEAGSKWPSGYRPRSWPGVSAIGMRTSSLTLDNRASAPIRPSGRPRRRPRIDAGPAHRPMMEAIIQSG